MERQKYTQSLRVRKQRWQRNSEYIKDNLKITKNNFPNIFLAILIKLEVKQLTVMDIQTM